MKLSFQSVALQSVPAEAGGSNSFPSMICTRHGRIVIAARRAPEKASCRGQRVALTWSDDLGTTWSFPIEPFTAPELDGRQGLFRVAFLSELPSGELLAALVWVDQSNPELEFFDPTTESLLDCRLFKSFSGWWPDMGAPGTKQRQDCDADTGHWCPIGLAGW